MLGTVNLNAVFSQFFHFICCWRSLGSICGTHSYVPITDSQCKSVAIEPPLTITHITGDMVGHGTSIRCKGG
jgi:hypothetical protein